MIPRAIKSRMAAALFALCFCQAALAQQDSPDQLLNKAMASQQAGDLTTAIREYRDFLKLRPNTVIAMVNLGAALSKQGNYDAAIEQYKAALPLVTDNASILLNLGLAYYKKNDFQGARQQFQPLYKQQPDNIRLAILLADSDLHVGDISGALVVLTPHAGLSNEKTPQAADFDYVYAAALLQSGKLHEGAEIMEKSADLSHAADSYRIAGTTFMQGNEYEKARHSLDEALRLDPHAPGSYSAAGIAHDRTGDVVGAESDFREALKVNPEDFDANLYLGGILLKRRDLAGAKTYLDHALRINSKDSMALYEEGMLQSADGELADAVETLKKSLAVDPSWLEPHVALVSLYSKLHRPEDGAAERQIVDRITAEQQAAGTGVKAP